MVNASRLGEYVKEVRQALRLGRRDCNVCLVSDREIKRLNSLYRGKARATDVLSFPWNAQRRPPRSHAGLFAGLRGGHPRARSKPARPRPENRGAKERAASEFKNFLGDIVISVDTAKRNARQEGHSTLNEIRWLILHGLLHLLGYNHESDRGEMSRLELSLRSRLGISGD